MKLFIVLIGALFPGLGLAAMAEEPLLYQFKVDELETDGSGHENLFWDAQFWVGRDLNKFWFKTEGERSKGATQKVEVQGLYSKAVSSYWDFQVGLRHDALSSPEQNWAVFGLQGLAPYFFEVDTALFVDDEGDAAFRFQAEYELLLTQRLILSPEIELNFYMQGMPDLQVGSGLSDMSLGVRLRYEIRREFAPYIGVSWKEYFGRTADYSSLSGEEVSETNMVAGFRIWF